MSTEETIKVLDSGYVRFIEAWGHGDAGDLNYDQDGVSFLRYNDLPSSDPDFECGIVEAARMSTQASFRGWQEDEKLLRTLYLSDPQHSTPFEFSGMTIEVQAPIIVFREWHRHRTQSYNEMSARYAPLPDVNYVPEWDVLKERGEKGEKSRNKQEKGTHPWDEGTASLWWKDLPRFYDYCERQYQWALKAGVPKEIARIVLPFARYSRMRATGNLRNWLAFMTLRYDPAPQWEIRQYATVLAGIIESKFPKTWALYVEKKSPEHRLSKFTDEQLRGECLRRGISSNPNKEEIS